MRRCVHRDFRIFSLEVPAFISYVREARKDPKLVKEGYGTKPNAAKARSMENEKKIDDALVLSIPEHERWAVGKAMSTRFGQRGGEVHMAIVPAMGFIEKDGLRMIEFDPAQVKQHAPNFSDGMMKDPPQKKYIADVDPKKKRRAPRKSEERGAKRAELWQAGRFSSCKGLTA